MNYPPGNYPPGTVLEHSGEPPLPFKMPQIPINRDHEALNRGTLGGPGLRVKMTRLKSDSMLLLEGVSDREWASATAVMPSSLRHHLETKPNHICISISIYIYICICICVQIHAERQCLGV